jgi:hypothetical protein
LCDGDGVLVWRDVRLPDDIDGVHRAADHLITDEHGDEPGPHLR